MQYWEVVTRSFRIAWRHKYLWLIALFSGEGGAGFNSSFNQGTGSRTGTPSTAQIQQQVTTWVSEHVGLIVFLIVLWVVLAVAFFILAADCEQQLWGERLLCAAGHPAWAGGDSLLHLSLFPGSFRFSSGHPGAARRAGRHRPRPPAAVQAPWPSAPRLAAGGRCEHRCGHP